MAYAEKNKTPEKKETRSDLHIQKQENMTQPDDEANEDNVNGRQVDAKREQLVSDGASTQARDNDSDTANGLLRSGDTTEEAQQPKVTEKFMNESVKK